jgi:lauroyl/myristoyl acyltransferase
MSWRGQLAILPYRVGETAAQVMPPRVGLAIANVGGAIAARFAAGRRQMVVRHQRRVRGPAADADGAVAATFESYARYWYEMMRITTDARRNEIARNFSEEGWQHVDDALAQGKGVIFACPHLGGWEYAAAWVAQEKGHRMLAVVESLQPPELYEWFVKQRSAIGLDITPLGPGVSTAVLGALRENRIVCLLSDRDLTGDGVEVEFFGETTTLPAGPATLALRSGAVILPVTAYFTADRGHHAVIRPPLTVTREGRLREDIARITQQLAREFETLIREAPEQWHLLQPNWPSDRVAVEG